MRIPDQYVEYECEEYFRNGWAEKGHFSKDSETWIVCPLTEAYEDAAISFFAVGRSGWGGIDFGYRKGMSGLWAYYPIDDDFELKAPTIEELVKGYCSGEIKV